MTEIAPVVRAYLSGRDVPFETDRRGVMSFTGAASNGLWRVFVNAREDAGIVVVHSLVGDPVPADRRPAMAELVTRANFGLLVGNFEIDLDDGELRFKTSLDVTGTPMTEVLFDRLLLANVAITDRYLPAVRAVLEGDDPVAALAAVESD